MIEDPEVKARLEAAGAVVTPMTVTQFKDFAERKCKYLRVIKQLASRPNKPVYSVIRSRQALNPRRLGHFRLT